MNRPTRVKSDAMGGLLGRQLASITDTLARASQRRDAELREKDKLKSPPAPAVQAPSPTDPSLISDTDDTGSNSGAGVMFVTDPKSPNTEDFSFGKSGLEKPQGDFAIRGSLPKGYASVDDPKRMLAEMSQDDFDNAQDGNDVSSMLASLGRPSSVDESADHDEVIDTRRLLARFERSPSTVDQMTIRCNDDPRGLPADDSDEDDDPRAMLTKLERKTPQLAGGIREDFGEDLQALHDRLMKSVSPKPARSPASEVAEVAGPKTACDPAIFPYVITILLDLACCKWEEVRGWSTYLFSSGLDGYKAQQEKERIVKQATEELKTIIAYTMGEEQRYHGKVSVERLPRRLIISNLAADAGLVDLEEFFYRHRFVVQEYQILRDRDPGKRTQVAYVDMFTREAALQASYMRGNIFGLVLDIKLAVENNF